MTIKVLKTFVPGGNVLVQELGYGFHAYARDRYQRVVASTIHPTRQGSMRMLFGALYERDRVDNGESE